jgi:hypothetical protein
MSIRCAALLAVLLAAATVLICSASALADSGTPTPLSPDQAQAYATAPAYFPGGSSSTTVVDGQTALNAAANTDAETSIEVGLSPEAAVGLVPLPQGYSLVATRPTCWANAVWARWGIWPYDQRITDTTYWCAVYGNHITYRSSTTTAGGTLCGVSWRAHALIAGGVGKGFTYFTNRASAGFSCQTAIPWITIHTTHHLDTKRTDRGVTSIVGTG